jgi:TolA-binding protein
MRLRLFAVALLLAVLGGCATKRDLRDLTVEINQLQARQESLLRQLERQNAAILDSLNAQDVRLRGTLANQLVQIERQLVQIQELTGQGQQQLAQMRQQLQVREEALRQAPPTTGPGADVGDPDELFTTARAAFQRGSLSTARAGFAEFVQAFPQDPRAPEARLHLATILQEEGEAIRALEEYSRILELHPNAPEAASALFRAALIEVDRGNRDRARSMLNQLTAAYPRSPEAELAREELRGLR